MMIRVILVGALKPKAPLQDGMDFEDGMTIQDVLTVLDLPADHVHACLVNETLIRDRQHELNDGDELTILPPVAGG
jgi:sulfur carrier protein ThiS